MPLWPHQERAIRDVCAAIMRGDRRILLTIPTGGGKTRVAEEIIRLYLEEGRRVGLYTNRKLLIDQTSRVMEAAGHGHGIRAAGYADEREKNFQISSIQTEGSRVLKRQEWDLHDAELVVVDECHLQASGNARTILDRHHEQGAVILGLTATPIGLGGMYDTLIVGGTLAELRECGALVPVHTYGPDEPDLKAKDIGRVELGEDLTEKQNIKAIMRQGIFGRVLKWYNRLNPAQTPTLLFGPGVKESAWFAEQFTKAGVRAAHLDGEEVWLDGEWQRTGRTIRQDILGQSRDGSIKVICCRYVMREGVDAPWIEHLIFATVLGSLQTYIQTGGRGMRASPETRKTHLTVQDHGGNYVRHGSLNADREWFLECTGPMLTGLRQERIRSKKCWRCKAPLRPGIPLCLKCGTNNEVEPARCPKCSRIVYGSKCSCGEPVDPTRKMREVVQSDGTLKELRGDAFPPRRFYKQPNGPAVWERMYYRARSDKWDATFWQAAALFAQENHWGWPDPSWPLMPVEERDWFRRVKDVPRERLVQKS